MQFSNSPRSRQNLRGNWHRLLMGQLPLLSPD